MTSHSLVYTFNLFIGYFHYGTFQNEDTRLNCFQILSYLVFYWQMLKNVLPGGSLAPDDSCVSVCVVRSLLALPASMNIVAEEHTAFVKGNMICTLVFERLKYKYMHSTYQKGVAI